MRIGQGFDVHELVSGRPCIIGGIALDYPKGLLGVTDADVLTHSIIDAILGALGAGDIGSVFPESEVQGSDSLELLQYVCGQMKASGYRLGNIDCTILAEAPKMSPYIPRMKQIISETCDILENQVSIKATTMEKMGFIGRSEGIGAMSVVLLEENLEERG
ncbi:2-C-methyl-D-erythritol 2,4-cyclodiphosphate synthase [Vagococcus coleopterorum]|uniref:2-C-methyl-D-erythritol 2,4-cyclodiphosphate synthase n=1 Tax=Vagococcus coleopterorum TaxID=2714946 RepID=A0A6G8AMC1_9ENTE|nr:2-C-methyl-D-erythritol 2,4-cyclodiphosphate synthase [Vagococcus coleopterorum]QIL46120.1 2-C-methyl-D-erythritol 2,4-cyclodiphosphate synthase [Vagococcus coleopterorum]